MHQDTAVRQQLTALSLEAFRHGIYAMADEHNGYLLESDAHERSICSRIAFHAQTYLSDHPLITVDCEYNRWGPDGEVKRTAAPDVSAEEISRVRATFERWAHLDDKSLWRTVQKETVTVLPDLIFHQRTHPHANWLVVELKLTTSQGEFEQDREKLCRYTDPDWGLHYEIGIFICMRAGASYSRRDNPVHEIRIYHNGRDISDCCLGTKVTSFLLQNP